MGVIISRFVIKTTPDAVGVVERDADEDEEITWIPRSVIDEGWAVEPGEQDLEVRTWWAEREGLG